MSAKQQKVIGPKLQDIDPTSENDLFNKTMKQLALPRN